MWRPGIEGLTSSSSVLIGPISPIGPIATSHEALLKCYTESLFPLIKNCLEKLRSNSNAGFPHAKARREQNSFRFPPSFSYWLSLRMLIP